MIQLSDLFEQSDIDIYGDNGEYLLDIIKEVNSGKIFYVEGNSWRGLTKLEQIQYAVRIEQSGGTYEWLP